MISTHPKSELIRLKIRNPKKKFYDQKPTNILAQYTDTKETREMRSRIVFYNNFIKNQSISLPSFPENFHNDLYRVFNEGCFTKGGRFYGGAYQTMKEGYDPCDSDEQMTLETRSKIIINGETTVELDFANCNLVLLYAKAEQQLPPNDLYCIPGFERDHVKKAVMVALANKTINMSIPNLQTWLDKDTNERKTSHVDAMTLIKKITNKHESIRHLFFQEEIYALQYTDSCICDLILFTLTKDSIPVLPVHDSFIVKHTDEDRLKEIMIEAFKEITQCRFEPKVLKSKFSIK